MVVLRENISLCTALVSRDCPCNVARNCCLGGVCACVFVSVCVARSTVIMSYITLKLLLDRSLPAASCNMLYNYIPSVCKIEVTSLDLTTYSTHHCSPRSRH